MSKTSFIKFIRTQPKLHLLTAGCLLITSFLYPGQNMLQTLVLHPGTVRSYSFPTPSLAPYPVSDGTPAPATSARGIVIQDVASKTILYSRGADLSLLPASTTKIMTALVARDAWPDLQAVLTVQNEDRAIGQTIDLVLGEQLTVESLLKGLLIHSGNDAALALADNYEGGYAAFVSAMNDKAKSLHLNHTVYKNPSGIEQYGHTTTPRDLAVLASIAMSDPVLREIVGTKYTMITDLTGHIAHPLESTNELLGEIPGLLGLKTGWTTNAGECLVSYVERDGLPAEEGHSVIIVILGSLDRFGDTRALIDWAYSHHTWQSIDTSH